MDGHPEYYIRATETELIDRAAAEINKLVAEPVAFALLGTGDEDALRRKDLRFVGEFKRVSAITAFDINPTYVQQALSVLTTEFGNKVDVGARRTDIFDKRGIHASRGNTEYTKLVTTMFGATLFNVGVQRDDSGHLVVPKAEILERLKALRKSLHFGDVFITTHDGNMDAEKVEAAYRGQTAFATNLAHRIRRDTPFKNIDAEGAKFRVEFDQASGILGHYLTLDFDGDGDEQEYLFNISVKVPKEEYLKWCAEAGFKATLSLEENGVHLHVLEAVSENGHDPAEEAPEVI